MPDLLALAREIEASTVPALSLKQPWAYAMIHQGKDVENRPRRGSHRGWTLIHTSAAMPKIDYERASAFAMEAVGVRFPPAQALARGAIIGALRIVDCVDHSDSPWWMGPHAFVCRDALAIEPVECRGTIFPLFWEPDRMVRAAVAAQIRAMG